MLSVIVVGVVLAFTFAVSYGITAGILYLACLCFGWEWWSWQAALGVWLVLVLVRGAIGRSDK